jgi:hypothetical protein
MQRPDTGEALPDYEYEPDEVPKRKHHWTEDRADFVFVRGTPIGKCPRSMTNAEARTLLNSGIPWFNPRAPGAHPDRVYVVHRGVIYRATATQVGKSFHAFPELPRELRALPKPMKKAIFDRAEELGELDAVIAWFDRDVHDDEGDES